MTGFLRDGICCFTGHRQLPEGPALETLTRRLDERIGELIARGVTTFRAGGALGFDTLAAEAVLRARATHGVRLELLLPCPSQPNAWAAADRARYEAVKAAADKYTYTAQHYYANCMLTRDRALVSGADVCLCYYTGSTGGTRYTVLYAMKQGLELINLYE